MTQFLPLTEYSSKYRVSISTLRRRIKAEDIRFYFEDGKYMILDEPMSTHQKVHRPSQTTSEETLMGAHVGAIVRESAPVFGLNSHVIQEENKEKKNRLQSPSALAQSQNMSMYSEENPSNPSIQNEETVLSAANRLLTELKKAYSQILQEKEEQILILKEEVSDLKTLAKVLEAENDRLKSQRR